MGESEQSQKGIRCGRLRSGSCVAAHVRDPNVQKRTPCMPATLDAKRICAKIWGELQLLITSHSFPPRHTIHFFNSLKLAL